MPDPTPTPPAVAPSPAPGPAAPEPTPPSTPVVKTEDAIPYPRFKEVNDQLKALKEEKEAREIAEKKAKDEKLKQDGEYQKLLEEREKEIERLKKIEGEFTSTQKSIRESALAKITDEKMREIAADLTTPKLLEFVEKLNAQPGGGGVHGKGKPTDKKADGLNPLPGETAYQYGERMKREYRRAK
jgi:hypothetical protein